MAFIKTNESKIGKQVILTEQKKSLNGFFEKGSLVTITGCDDYRGYEFTDEYGNRVTEAGFGGFIDA